MAVGESAVTATVEQHPLTRDCKSGQSHRIGLASPLFALVRDEFERCPRHLLGVVALTFDVSSKGYHHEFKYHHSEALNAEHVWAHETIWDPSSLQFMVYWSTPIDDDAAESAVRV